ncbi:hypothetical protein ACE6H2_013694 [Prunus campanulata]
MGKDSDEGKADFKRSPQETDHLLGSPANFVVDISSAEYDHSMQTQHIQMVKPYEPICKKTQSKNHKTLMIRTLLENNIGIAAALAKQPKIDASKDLPTKGLLSMHNPNRDIIIKGSQELAQKYDVINKHKAPLQDLWLKKSPTDMEKKR